MRLKLQQRHITSIEKEARRMYPIEACGMLFGKTTPSEAVVQKIVTSPNILQSPKRFEINPEAVVKTITECEKEGLAFIGLFHSHPAPPDPSPVDLKFMKLWGDAIWLILSSTQYTLAAFQIKDDELNQVHITIK
ncbi:MAG: M67 family metallopeptidase [Candidatus Bathyarchaeota archaeon]|nr:MAG: M67 family metallopeptidase [Candidatus Bathyarchaeota archaeon]